MIYPIVNATHSFGRQLVIDFGLSGLFDRFEKYFGARVVWWLCFLIALAVGSTCIKLIWSLILPIYRVFREAILKEADHFAVADASLTAFLLFLIVFGAVILANTVDARNKLKTIAARSEETEEILTRAEHVSEAVDLIKADFDGISPEIQKLLIFSKKLSEARSAGRLADFIEEMENNPDSPFVEESEHG